MLTFVIYARRTPEVLGRMVSLFHRRAIAIERLTAERGEKPHVLRVTIVVEADAVESRRIEANLYKLVDVLLVESGDQRIALRASTAREAEFESRRVIYVITTGGTVEKACSEPSGPIANLDSKIDCYLRLLRLPDCDLRVVPLFNKDSLEMTESDRRMILRTVSALLPEGAPIIITHGPDTMVHTGLYLQYAIPEVKVPIVFTGAMVPLGLDGSDALRNLTESLFAARFLNPGIYVVIHGETFPIYRVRKDDANGRFVWTNENLM
jgi:L-asparaginase